MIDLHAFSLKKVTTEFESRLIEPDPVSVTTNGTQIETRDSIQARHRAYDEYEIYDISLSRLVVDSLLSLFFRNEIQTRFSQISGFFTSQVKYTS